MKLQGNKNLLQGSKDLLPGSTDRKPSGKMIFSPGQALLSSGPLRNCLRMRLTNFGNFDRSTSSVGSSTSNPICGMNPVPHSETPVSPRAPKAFCSARTGGHRRVRKGPREKGAVRAYVQKPHALASPNCDQRLNRSFPAPMHGLPPSQTARVSSVSVESAGGNCWHIAE